MDSLQALQAFWSSFGLKAYDENTVPDDAMTLNGGKYLTYSAATGYFDALVTLSASLWYKSTSWAEISQKAAEIGEAIGYGGRLISFGGGHIWIQRGTPFSQRMSDEDDTIRRIYINLSSEFLTT